MTSEKQLDEALENNRYALLSVAKWRVELSKATNDKKEAEKRMRQAIDFLETTTKAVYSAYETVRLEDGGRYMEQRHK